MNYLLILVVKKKREVGFPQNFFLLLIFKSMPPKRRKQFYGSSLYRQRRSRKKYEPVQLNESQVRTYEQINALVQSNDMERLRVTKESLVKRGEIPFLIVHALIGMGELDEDGRMLHLQEAHMYDPNNVNLLCYMARILTTPKHKNFELAEIYYRRSLEMVPDNPFVYRALCAIYEKTGRWNDIVTLATKGIDRFGGTNGDAETTFRAAMGHWHRYDRYQYLTAIKSYLKTADELHEATFKVSEEELKKYVSLQDQLDKIDDLLMNEGKVVGEEEKEKDSQHEEEEELPPKKLSDLQTHEVSKQRSSADHYLSARIYYYQGLIHYVYGEIIDAMVVFCLAYAAAVSAQMDDDFWLERQCIHEILKIVDMVVFEARSLAATATTTTTTTTTIKVGECGEPILHFKKVIENFFELDLSIDDTLDVFARKIHRYLLHFKCGYGLRSLSTTTTTSSTQPLKTTPLICTGLGKRRIGFLLSERDYYTVNPTFSYLYTQVLNNPKKYEVFIFVNTSPSTIDDDPLQPRTYLHGVNVSAIYFIGREVSTKDAVSIIRCQYLDYFIDVYGCWGNDGRFDVVADPSIVRFKCLCFPRGQTYPRDFPLGDHICVLDDLVQSEKVHPLSKEHKWDATFQSQWDGYISDRFIYGSIVNDINYINTKTISLWIQILENVPHAILAIYCPVFCDLTFRSAWREKTFPAHLTERIHTLGFLANKIADVRPLFAVYLHTIPTKGNDLYSSVYSLIGVPTIAHQKTMDDNGDATYVENAVSLSKKGGWKRKQHLVPYDRLRSITSLDDYFECFDTSKTGKACEASPLPSGSDPETGIST